MKLLKKIKYTGTLHLVTGLHIGDSKENAEIGGVDSPVVRRKDNNIPYIPGSSLKGKIRSLLEQSYGATEIGGSTEVNKLFGITGEKVKPSRLIVRDAYMTKESVKKLEDNTNTDLPFTAIKFENTSDRVTGATVKGGLRNIERIPAGTNFKIEFIINCFEGEDKEMLKKMLKDGIKLLENDYLGGSGTRGYGQVKIELDKPVIVYQNPNTKS